MPRSKPPIFVEKISQRATGLRLGPASRPVFLPNKYLPHLPPSPATSTYGQFSRFPEPAQNEKPQQRTSLFMTDAMTRPTVSPFLEPGLHTKPRSLAILQLSRDNLLPIYLQEASGEHDGYAEGAVVNTRYGSFPHSTMLNVPWGSQIRASKVDTGSRGRKRKRGPKDDASRDDAEENQPETADNNATEAIGVKQAVADDSGFIHVLPPTPELWTQSLPHRTQVVYTPDYSYILHRIRARPGSTIIEAGAGSGSFTHASVRAVYNGYPSSAEDRKGKVFSFEYHEERYHKMKKELTDHNLDGLVHLTHRDVYNGGFLIDGKSPEADAIFLDLPKPWEALPHLSRRKPQHQAKEGEDSAAEWTSPLNPKRAVHICTFSPCIEQVTRTVSAMRRLGWVDIDMVEIANRKLHTIRDRVGLHYQTDRGVNVSPHDVEEALERLAEIEERVREQAARPRGAGEDGAEDADTVMKNGDEAAKKDDDKTSSAEQPPFQTPWVDGRLITKGEPEIKTHTSYLVFAVLPREWTEEDEAAAFAKYPCGKEKAVVGSIDKQTRKKERREQLQKIGDRKARRKERAEKIAEAVE